MRNRIAAITIAVAATAVLTGVASSSGGRQQVARTVNARSWTHLNDYVNDRAASPARKRKSKKTKFIRGRGSLHTISSTDPAQFVTLNCPAHWTAIAGGFIASSPLVLLSTDAFDPIHKNAMDIAVTYLGNSSATWSPEGTCEK
jgi:hypothetical protein